MTEKLYYIDSYIKEFDATVLSCVKNGNTYEIILDKTAFFPEGGGQNADKGCIGDAPVFDVQEKENSIVHFSNREVSVGKEYTCKIDWNLRFKRMQEHSGEHIISGIVHSLYGYDNIGFHMDDDVITIDFNGELDRNQLNEVELKANNAVWDNIDIQCYIPEPSQLSVLDYRSKLELTENVRLVKIGDVDLCACCAPHVSKTGEIGVIKILDFMRHRGGIRLTAKCGEDALFDYRDKYKNVYEISQLLSAKQNETSNAVERVKNELDELYREFYNFRQNVAENACDNLKFSKDTSYYISENFDADMLRIVVNYGMDNSTLSLAFSGNDNDGYSYIAGSKSLNMKDVAKYINSALNGRGGGRDTMIQGKVASTKENIIKFTENINLGDI